MVHFNHLFYRDISHISVRCKWLFSPYVSLLDLIAADVSSLNYFKIQSELFIPLFQRTAVKFCLLPSTHPNMLKCYFVSSWKKDCLFSLSVVKINISWMHLEPLKNKPETQVIREWQKSQKEKCSRICLWQTSLTLWVWHLQTPAI